MNSATDGKQITEINVKGQKKYVRSLNIEDRTVVIANRWPRIASLKDEDYILGEGITDPAAFVDALKRSGGKADLLTFIQKLPDTEPKHRFHMEWDNVAAIPLTGYQDWLNKQINGNMRKILRRSAKRGVSVKQVDFTDEFVEGVVEIYNENPVRQKKSFWHYGKSFDVVKEENGTYVDRSIFLGAYFEEKLIGYAKLVLVDGTARFMQIVSMTAHHDKLPANSLIAKSVEVSAERGCTHLIYGKYVYGKMGYTSLTEFKARNGFKQYLIPRYYVPLTPGGEIAMRLRLHRGVKELVPQGLLKMLSGTRAALIRVKAGRRAGAVDLQGKENETIAADEEAVSR